MCVLMLFTVVYLHVASLNQCMGKQCTYIYWMHLYWTLNRTNNIFTQTCFFFLSSYFVFYLLFTSILLHLHSSSPFADTEAQQYAFHTYTIWYNIILYRERNEPNQASERIKANEYYYVSMFKLGVAFEL